jgi:hypothetical protein
LGDLSTNARIILNCMIKKWVVRMWIGIIWLKWRQVPGCFEEGK